MKFNRRQIALGVCAAALCASAPVHSQAKYPARPVKFIVPFAPGGGSDTFARLIADKLTSKHGYTVVVENKPGAGGNLGAEAALREPADGYTFLFISTSYAVNATLHKPSFDPVSAIVPVVQITREAPVLAVGPGTGYKTLHEFVAGAKANPDKVSYGSSGAGGLAHVAAESFNALAGIKITHVPYKGTSAALAELLRSAADGNDVVLRVSRLNLWQLQHGIDVGIDLGRDGFRRPLCDNDPMPDVRAVLREALFRESRNGRHRSQSLARAHRQWPQLARFGQRRERG
jgi:tripartite-type tricarboxylate transporter receptor subunit TctC